MNTYGSRNDRRGSSVNRKLVAWLFIIILISITWIGNLYNKIEFIKSENNLYKIDQQNKEKDKESLYNVIDSLSRPRIIVVPSKEIPKPKLFIPKIDSIKTIDTNQVKLNTDTTDSI